MVQPKTRGLYQLTYLGSLHVEQDSGMVGSSRPTGTLRALSLCLSLVMLSSVTRIMSHSWKDVANNLRPTASWFVDSKENVIYQSTDVANLREDPHWLCLRQESTHQPITVASMVNNSDWPAWLVCQPPWGGRDPVINSHRDQ